jgi:ubiquinone/menaquinone biosynthesis C-methylase UbiE
MMSGVVWRLPHVIIRYTEGIAFREWEESMGESRKSYLPAARYDWALPLYDPVVRFLGADKARRLLLDHAAPGPGQQILDVGCGTGSLLILVKRMIPDVEVTGIDPDPQALARARRKAERECVSVQFDEGFSDELPYPDKSFDRVFSSFMFHHLPAGEKAETLSEVRRVLKAGGSFHMVDFGMPESTRAGLLSRLLHSGHRFEANAPSRVLALLREAGFAEATKTRDGSMFIWRITYYKAQ